MTGLLILGVLFSVVYLLLNLRLPPSAQLEQNDIVLLKREYKKRYPHISTGLPLRIVHCNGQNVEVTFVRRNDEYICNEILAADAVKKV